MLDSALAMGWVALSPSGFFLLGFDALERPVLIDYVLAGFLMLIPLRMVWWMMLRPGARALGSPQPAGGLLSSDEVFRRSQTLVRKVHRRFFSAGLAAFSSRISASARSGKQAPGRRIIGAAILAAAAYFVCRLCWESWESMEPRRSFAGRPLQSGSTATGFNTRSLICRAACSGRRRWR